MKRELNEEIIKSLKEANPDRALYKKNVAGQDYIFTYLTKTDHGLIADWITDNQGKLKPSDVDDKIVNYGLLWPLLSPVEGLSVPAGVHPSLSKYIQEMSGLDPDGVENIPYVSYEQLVEYTPVYSISVEEIDKAKKTFKVPLRKVTIDGDEFIIRPLMRPEFTSIQKNSGTDGFDGELETTKKCMLLPKDVNFDKLRAGIPGILAEQVMSLSGFVNDSEIEEL